MRHDHLLWLIILSCPVFWFIDLETSFALAPLGASTAGRAAMFIVSAATLAATVIAALFSWRDWRTTEKGGEGRSPGQRALSLGAVVITISFILVILAQDIPNFMLSGRE